MRILRICVAVLFVIVLCVFAFVMIRYKNVDKTYPVITLDSDTISVKLGATDEEMLDGVHATDGKDGDISDRVIVESISRFKERGVSVIKYAVCDSDNHVTSATRDIIFENYTSPRFTLSSSLIFGISKPINIRSIIGARDAIDGNISNKVIITAEEYSSTTAGGYTVSAKVSNSKGDMVSLDLPVYVEEIALSAPVIELRQYLAYLKVGEKFDVQANIVSALDQTEIDLASSVTVDTNLNTSKAGMYEVHYRVTDSEDRTGHAFAIVIVED